MFFQGKQETIIIIIIAIFPIMGEMNNRPFKKKKKKPLNCDLLTCTCLSTVFFSRPCGLWQSEFPQELLSNKTGTALAVQMQMLSHQLKIAPIINFEKYNNSRSPLRTQSMTRHRQLPIHSPLLSFRRPKLQRLLGQKS